MHSRKTVPLLPQPFRGAEGLLRMPCGLPIHFNHFDAHTTGWVPNRPISNVDAQRPLALTLLPSTPQGPFVETPEGL